MLAGARNAVNFVSPLLAVFRGLFAHLPKRLPGGVPDGPAHFLKVVLDFQRLFAKAPTLSSIKRSGICEWFHRIVRRTLETHKLCQKKGDCRNLGYSRLFRFVKESRARERNSTTRTSCVRFCCATAGPVVKGSRWFDC